MISFGHCADGAVPYIRAMPAVLERVFFRLPRRIVFRLAGVVLAALPLSTAPAAESAAAPTVLIVVGASGEEEFGQNFSRNAGLWAAAARQAGANPITIGLDTNATASDHDRLQQALAGEAKEGPAELWLVLLGHGTYDGKEAKFNLRGADLSATELAAWLKPVRRPLALLNTTAASAPFLQSLSASNRVILTATRRGSEVNYTRLGTHLAEAIADPSADLDKDGQTSLLEAFLMAARRTAEFYETEGRMMTEHALLDDNGDGLGTQPDWFRGIRAVKSAKDGAPLDGARAHQFHLVRSESERQLPAELRARRDELEVAIAKLRQTRSGLSEEKYYQQLETLLLELARLYEQSAPKKL